MWSIQEKDSKSNKQVGTVIYSKRKCYEWGPTLDSVAHRYTQTFTKLNIFQEVCMNDTLTLEVKEGQVHHILANTNMESVLFFF